MSFIKRAFIYCFRQRIRTFILFLLLTVISTLLITGLAVRGASSEAAADVRTAVGGKIELEPDTDGHIGMVGQNEWGTTYAYNGDFITEDIVRAVKEVEGVADYNSEDTKGYWGAGVDFKYLPAALDLSYTPYGASSGHTATISSEKCSDFVSGNYRLIEGEHITADDKRVCLISKELADYNGLSVGDKVKMYSLDSDAITEFRIKGIFDGTEGTAGNALTIDEIPANCGYIDYATMFELFGDEQDGYGQLTIYVDDPLEVQNVCGRISDLPELKGKTLKLSIDTEEYSAVQTPLESIHDVANAVIIVIVIVSLIVLTLILTLWIRGRKKEIGIYMSVGRSKPDIIGQFYAETVITAAAAFAACALFGVFAAQRLGWLLISGRALDSSAFDIGITDLLFVYLIVTAVIAAALTLALWTVFRLKPRDILSRVS